MSFSTEVKNELCRNYPSKKICELAEMGGFVRVAGDLVLPGKGRMELVLTTDNPAIARHYMTLIKNYFHASPKLLVDESRARGRKRRYQLVLDAENRAEQILRETGILLVKQGHNYITDGIYETITRSKSQRKAYLKGLFLGSGSVTHPQKGYHMEFLCTSKILADDLVKLIGKFYDITAKSAVRRGKPLVYLKHSGHIRDMIALMGADSHVLFFDDVMLKKQMMNETVRLTNCDNANTDRIISASERQVNAIRKIKASGLWSDVSPKLKEAAELRLAHPEAPLGQLAAWARPPIGKSGMNNRLQKLLLLANAEDPS